MDKKKGKKIKMRKLGKPSAEKDRNTTNSVKVQRFSS
jgi:hypothetical protein